MKIFVKIFIFSLFLNPIFINAASLKELYSDHFIIISDKNVDQEYIYKIKDMAEYFYKIVTQEFNFIRESPWLWKNRSKIFVAKSKDEYIKECSCPEWSSACVDYRTKTIFTYPQQEDFSSILSHELTHIIFREYLNRERLPLWLDEGVSVYVDYKYKDNQYDKELVSLKDKISEGKYIKFDELNNVTFIELKSKPKEYVEMFYFESFSVINFLIKKWSRYNLNNFFKFLKDGYNIKEALCKSYGVCTLENLEEKWIKFYQM